MAIETLQNEKQREKLEENPENYGLWDHLLSYYLWLVSHCNSRMCDKNYDTQNQKHLLSGFYTNLPTLILENAVRHTRS